MNLKLLLKIAAAAALALVIPLVASTRKTPEAPADDGNIFKDELAG